MLREMVGLVLLSVVVASTALAKPPAGDPPPPSHIYRFAGFSTGFEEGDAGIPAMYATCQVDFGDSARMCTFEGYILSPNAEQTATKAWVYPTEIIPTGSSVIPGASSCELWSTQAVFGFAIGQGRELITIASCGSARPITCCTPLQ